jgi:hypothetical protein
MQYLNGFYAALDTSSYSLAPEALEHLTKLMAILTKVGCKVVEITNDQVDIVVHKEKPKARGKGKEDGKLHVLESWVLAIPTDGSKIDFPDKEFLAKEAEDSVMENFTEKTKAAYYLALESQVTELKAKVAELEQENQRLRDRVPTKARVRDSSDAGSGPKRLRDDMPEDVKQAFIECYGQYARNEPVPACAELSDTEESAQKLKGSSRLHRFYKANAAIRGYFKDHFPNPETFRKNYNQAVADLYTATLSSGDIEAPRMESVSVFGDSE